MTPKAIAAEAKAAGLKNISLPTKSVAGKTIDTGAEARTFAEYMRIHALEASGGKTYAQMPRYATADGKGTNDAKADVWITETALSTALNTSYFAENVALFSIVMGVALLLTGIGFLVLALGLVKVPFHRPDESASRTPRPARFQRRAEPPPPDRSERPGPSRRGLRISASQKRRSAEDRSG